MRRWADRRRRSTITSFSSKNDHTDLGYTDVAVADNGSSVLLFTKGDGLWVWSRPNAPPLEDSSSRPYTADVSLSRGNLSLASSGGSQGLAGKSRARQSSIDSLLASFSMGRHGSVASRLSFPRRGSMDSEVGDSSAR